VRILDNRSIGRLRLLTPEFALRISLPLVGHGQSSIKLLQYKSYLEK
jgi:hypothetical protein